MVCNSVASVARHQVTLLGDSVLYQSVPGKRISDQKIYSFHSDHESGSQLEGNQASNVTTERDALLLFLPMQAIKAQYAGSQNELYGVDAIFDDDSDEVVLDIGKDGVKTKEGWSIEPLMDPPSVRYSRS